MRYACLLLSIVLCPAWGQGLGVEDTGRDHVRPSLHLEHSAVSAGGVTTLAVRFALTKEWHLYWTNPGDSGDAPSVELSLPEGVRAGAIQWPLPQRHVLPGDLLGHLYEGELVLLIPLAVSADLAPGDYAFKAQLGWLVCKDVCLMGDAALEGSLTVGPAKTDPATRDLFAGARTKLPRAPQGDELLSSWDGDALSLHVPGALGLVFFPESEPEAVDLIRAGLVEGDRLVVRYPNLPSKPTAVRGILRVLREGKVTALRVEVTAPAGTD